VPGEAAQDWVPVPLSGTGMALISLRQSRVDFTERLCKEPKRLEQWLCVAVDWPAAWLLTRAEARRGGNPRAGGGGKPLGAAWRDRQDDIDQRRGTRLWAVKRRRSFASEMNASNVQRPGRGVLKMLRSIGSPDTESN
jgi:hypothetical protein